MAIIFCTKQNIDEKTSWRIPSKVIERIQKIGSSQQVTIMFQQISWIPKEFQEIHNNSGIIVTQGWNGSFHDCVNNSCVVSFEVGRRAGRIGRTRNNFKRALSIAQQNKKDKQVERFINRQAVRPGD